MSGGPYETEKTALSSIPIFLVVRLTLSAVCLIVCCARVFVLSTRFCPRAANPLLHLHRKEQLDAFVPKLNSGLAFPSTSS